MSQINVDVIDVSTDVKVRVLPDLAINVNRAAALATKTNGIIVEAYKNYVVKLSQITTGAPTVLELSNTLSGAVAWTRVSEGFYEGTLTGAFTGNLLMLFNNPINSRNIYFYNAGSADTIYIDCTDANTGLPVDYNGDELYLEVRVY